MAVGVGLLMGVVPLSTLSSAAAPPSTVNAAAKPPGNNGTIKIDQITLDPGDQGGHDNDPHVACAFDLQAFGYDLGTQTIVTDFTAQPPSGHGQSVTPEQGRHQFTFPGTGAGNHLDATERYVLDVSGLTLQPKQGYHIKLTVHVTGSQGADVKHKVFWYQPCAPTSSQTSQSPTPTPTPTLTPLVTPTVTVSPTQTETATAAPTETETVGGTVSGGQGSTVLPTRTSLAPTNEASKPATVVEGEHITKTIPKAALAGGTRVLGVKFRYPRAVQAGDGGLLGRRSAVGRRGAFLVAAGTGLVAVTALPWRRRPRRVRRHAQ